MTEHDAPAPQSLGCHTPGPWFCEYGTDGYYGLYHNGDEALDQNVAANERLIAAAPELLDALIRCEEMVSTDKGPPDWESVRTAISRATQVQS